MKRSTLIVPALAVLVGVLLLLLRKAPAPESVRPEPAVLGVEAPRLDAHGHPIPPSRPPRSEDKVPDGTGGFRFRVHHRGEPLPEAEIQVTQAFGSRPNVFKTSADGTRSLVGLPPGEYSITASHPPKYLPSSLHFPVEAGRIYEINLDLNRGCRIHGMVLNTSATPLKDAQITLIQKDGTANTPFRTSSDEQGRFMLEPVDPGSYRISASHARHKSRADLQASLPHPGDSFEVNIVMDPGSMLAGRVVDEDDRPVEDARVIAASPESTGTTKTDKEGRFTIYGLAATPTNLSAQKQGLGMVYLRNAAPNSTDLVLRLPTPGTVHGRILADPQPGNFGVGLYGYDEGLKQKAPLYSRFFTSADGGRFVLTDVAPGTYTAEIILDGWELVSVPTFTVKAKGIVENVELTLRPKK